MTMCGYNIYDERLEDSGKPICKRDKNGIPMLSEYELEIFQLKLRETYKTFKEIEKVHN